MNEKPTEVQLAAIEALYAAELNLRAAPRPMDGRELQVDRDYDTAWAALVSAWNGNATEASWAYTLFHNQQAA